MINNRDFLIHRACPACGQLNQSVLAEVKCKQDLQSLGLPELRENFVGLRKNQVFFDYIRCTECRTLYCPTYFSSDSIKMLYMSMPDNFMGESEELITKTQENYAFFALKHLKEIQNFIEIGPDQGTLGRKFQQFFKIKQITYVEPNVLAHENLRTQGKVNSTVKIYSDLDEVPESKYDFFIGIHVFDHLLEPRQVIKRLAEFSNNGSLLLSVVHNEKSILRKVMKTLWPPFCLQHPQLYNPETLKLLFESEGWKLLEIKKSTNWFSLHNLIGKLLALLGLPNKFLKWIPNIVIPIRLGNLIAIFVYSDEISFISEQL